MGGWGKGPKKGVRVWEGVQKGVVVWKGGLGSQRGSGGLRWGWSLRVAEAKSCSTCGKFFFPQVVWEGICPWGDTG